MTLKQTETKYVFVMGMCVCLKMCVCICVERGVGRCEWQSGDVAGGRHGTGRQAAEAEEDMAVGQ